MPDNKDEKNEKDSKSSSKFDLKDLVGNIKSMLGQDGTPEPVSGDALGEMMKEISEATQQLAEQHAAITHQLHELNHKVNELFQGLDAFRTMHVIGIDSEVAVPKTEKDEKDENDEKNTSPAQGDSSVHKADDTSHSSPDDERKDDDIK